MSQPFETAPATAGATSGHTQAGDAHHPEANTAGATANFGRVVAASCFGTAIEWYDFSSTAFAPIVFDRLFFPQLDAMTGMIAVFATFAVGFLARPIGGIVFDTSATASVASRSCCSR